MAKNSKTAGNKAQTQGKGKTNGFVPKKTVCPLTRDEFLENATTVSLDELNVNGIQGKPKVFSTGSFGYNINGKVTLIVEVDGEEREVRAQVTGNIIIIGSKEAGSEESAD